MSNARSIADLLGKAGEFSDTEVVLGDSSDTRLFIPGVGLDTNLATDNSSPVWNASTGKFTFSPVGTGTNIYDSASSLPITGVSAGQQAFAKDTNRLYIYNGSGWYSVALINRNPSITSVLQSSYTLDSNAGDATVITILAQDSDGIPLTYTATTTDSGNELATITQGSGDSSNVFTIQAKTLADILAAGYDSDGGTFDITFRASDGINLAAVISEFTISFSAGIENSKYTALLLKSVGTNNGTNSSFTDASTNSHTITANGNVHAGTFSPYAPGGYSYYFDGLDDYISFPYDANLVLNTSFTIEFWTYMLSGGGGGYGAVSFYQMGEHNFRIDGANDGTSLKLLINQTDTVLDVTSGIDLLNDWHHIAYSYDGTTVRLFVDGVLKGSATRTVTQTQTGGNMAIGINTASVGDVFDYRGYISDLRHVRGTAVYTSAFTPPTDRLTVITNTELLTCHLPYAVDGSSNGHTITVNANAKAARFTPFDHKEYSSSVNGGSLYFDGTGDYLTVPHATSLNLSSGDFTIEGWFYPLDTGTSYIFSKDGQASVAYVAYGLKFDSDGKVKAYVGNATTLSGTPIQTLTSTSSYSANTWYHFAFVKNGTTLTIYLNGQQEATATQTQTIVDDGDPLYIGWENGQPTAEYANGYLSNIRIVKGTAVYTSAFTPPATPLTAITNTSLLINGTDGSIIDYSGSTNVAVTASDDVVSSTAVTKYGSSSIKFDGTGYATIFDEPFGTGDFTVEFWCYASAYSTYQLAYDNRYLSATGIGIYLGQNSQLQLANNSAIQVNNAGSLATNQWNHIAVTRESGTIYFYINGTKSASTFSDTRDYTGTGALIGGNSVGTQNFTGYMEDIRVTKGLARYTASFTPPTEGLIG